eukprot:m.58939 g.58939  ORF g.58939 m.58939 type:complete len:175 (+) comp7854_c0_seq1:108-632(+)
MAKMMEAQGMKVDSEKMQAMKGMLDSIDPDDMKDLVGMAASMQSEVGEAPTQAEQLKKMQEAMAKNPEMGEKMRKTLGKQLQNTKLIGSVKEQVSSETVKQGAQQMGHDLGDKTATFVAVVIRAFLSLWMGLIAVWQMTKAAAAIAFADNLRSAVSVVMIAMLIAWLLGLDSYM